MFTKREAMLPYMINRAHDSAAKYICENVDPHLLQHLMGILAELLSETEELMNTPVDYGILQKKIEVQLACYILILIMPLCTPPCLCVLIITPNRRKSADQ